MVKKFKELEALDMVMGHLYREDDKLQYSKFGYAYKRFADKAYYPIYKEYVNNLAQIRIDNALEDPVTHEILRTPREEGGRGYRYSKEGTKAVMQAEEELETSWAEKEFEVEPYFAPVDSIPTDLAEEHIALMKGLIIE
jgi:hypothetical protein